MLWRDEAPAAHAPYVAGASSPRSTCASFPQANMLTGLGPPSTQAHSDKLSQQHSAVHVLQSSNGVTYRAPILGSHRTVSMLGTVQCDLIALDPPSLRWCWQKHGTQRKGHVRQACAARMEVFLAHVFVCFLRWHPSQSCG